MRSLRAAAVLLAGAAYALAEPYAYRIRHKSIPVPSSAPPLRILHLSDTHLIARHRPLISFLEGLPGRIQEPDLVLVTGDMIEDDSGIDPLIDVLTPLRARHGIYYVLGSHDYFQSRFKSPTRYFARGDQRVSAVPADVERLEKGFGSLGWVSLNNRTEFFQTAAGRVRLAGVDDPYIGRHRTGHIERAAEDVLAIGMTHSPDVVSDWLLNGYDLVVAGHTHGGQVRFPGIGALITNCSLPTDLAAGANAVGGGWLHVSTGLGTSKFTPIRALCPPEVTVLELEPQERTEGL